MIAFTVAGRYILRFFGITTHAFQIAGGIIFFSIGWDMLQARKSRVKTTDEEETEYAQAAQRWRLRGGFHLLVQGSAPDALAATRAAARPHRLQPARARPPAGAASMNVPLSFNQNG